MKNNVKNLVLLAVLAAIAYLLVAFVRIPVVMFLSYEPKDVILAVAGFLLGPFASFLIALVVSLLEMVTISSTGIIGCFMNLLSSASFACCAALVYKHKRTQAGATIGLLLGSLTMVAAMLLWNWLVTPWYMGVEREYVEGLLLPAFLPFNLLKAGLNTGLTLCLYKPLANALRRTGFLEQRSGTASNGKLGTYLLAGGLLVTCVIILLVLQGKL